MLAREAQNHSLKEGIDFMKRLLIAFVLIGVSLLAIACGQTKTTETGKTIKSAPVGNNLTVTLSNKDGVFRHGDQDFFVSFKDSSGKLVEVGAVGLTCQMPAMGTMPGMNNAATLTATSTPGVYQGKLKLETAGDWQAQLSYEGPAGKGKTTFTVTAQ